MMGFSLALVGNLGGCVGRWWWFGTFSWGWCWQGQFGFDVDWNMSSSISHCLALLTDHLLGSPWPHHWDHLGPISWLISTLSPGSSQLCLLAHLNDIRPLLPFQNYSVGCSTLPSPGYSMWNPWNGGWIPWNGGWIPYFWWMDSMEWGMDSIPFPGGFHTFSRWIPYYFHMESRWNKFLAS